MTPIVSIVGRSKSGKTRLIEKLVTELRKRGYRVATIKHAQEIHFEPGKDSSRHIEAGSEATVVAAPDQIVLIKPVSSTVTPDEIARLMGDDYDIILTEGFKQANAPKIEVYRSQSGPLLEGISKVIAIVADEALDTKTRQFPSDDIKALADLLEKGFIVPQSNRLTLHINNTPVTMTHFPKQIVSNVLEAMVTSLKGVGEISSLELFLKRESKEAKNH